MLDVIALDIAAEPVAEVNNALGTTMPKHYHHLYDKAGEQSRASSIRRGVTTMWSHPYSAHIADKNLRLSDMVSRSAKRLADSVQDAGHRVRGVLHTQATLDQQIVGSTCLRLEEEAFPSSEEAMTVGQCGTAGLGAALRLAQLLPALDPDEPNGLVAITAGDKWIAPFHRKLGCFRFGDAAGGLIAGRDEPQSIGHIKRVETCVFSPLEDIWTADEDASAAYVFEHALAVCRKVLGGYETEARDAEKPEFVCGDVTTKDVGERLTRAFGLESLCPTENSDISLNTSSASPLAAMAASLERAAATDRNVQTLIWSVSPSGNATAFIFTAFPSQQTEQGVWI